MCWVKNSENKLKLFEKLCKKAFEIKDLIATLSRNYFFHLYPSYFSSAQGTVVLFSLILLFGVILPLLFGHLELIVLTELRSISFDESYV